MKKLFWISILMVVVALAGCEFNPMGIPEWRPAETVVDLNIRTGPGTEYDTVGIITQGEIVEVSRDSEGVFHIWRRIRFSEEEYEYWISEGTIYDKYIKFLD